jgi:hypothetical protein
MTRTQKISSVGAILAALVSMTTLASSRYRPALLVDLEPIECESLQNTISRLRDDKREYRRDLKEDPQDSFAERRIEDLEQEINERETQRRDLGCV